MSTVQLTNITKNYGGFVAVDNISISIDQGEFIALLGPSGCGKTTTLRMLAGFTDPTAGEIVVDKRVIQGTPPHKRNIGVVFQNYALFPHLTVFDNVAFGLKMRSVASSDIQKRVQRALDLVQLYGMNDRYPKELSGGQQQRVALARALVIEPSVLLLDEPLSNLDANLREQMRFEIKEIQQRIGITTVFVTHDQGEAIAAADRLVVMKSGQIRQIGTPMEVYEKPTDTFVADFIGKSNLLSGKVTGVSGAQARFATEAGEVVVSAPAGASEGQQMVLSLRPEDLRLTRTPAEGRNNLPIRIERVSYLGSTISIKAFLGEQELAISLPRGEEQPNNGDRLFLDWPMQIGTLLEARDEG